jgi:uncharacterized protein YaaN involved in tellurite resistance
VTEPTAAPSIQISFGEAEPLPVPEPAPTPVSTGLATVVARSPEPQPERLVCSKLVVGASLAQARREAAQLFPRFLQHPEAMMDYGVDALQGVNRLVDRLLKEVDPVRIPQLHAMLGDLNRQMLAIKGKYDVNDPKFRQEYDDYLKGVKRILRKARDFVALMKADIQSIETQLDKMGKDLAGKQFDMTRNVKYYNQLLDENEDSIIQLIYKIGVMELIVEEARRDAANITVGDASLGDRGEAQRQQRADLISNLEIKIADYKGRLFVAWATSPHTLMMRSLDVGMANKLNTLVQVTIPQMKLVLVQWRMMLQTYEAAQNAEAITAMSNRWTQEFFQQGAQVMPAIAQIINQPTVWPETMRAVTEALTQAAEGILTAYQVGEEKRVEVDQTMVQSAQVLGDVHHKINAAVIGQIVGSAQQPVPVEIATSVPRAITAG